jgi:hypothetical protein
MKSATVWLTTGLLMSLSAAAIATTRYVNLNNPAPAFPYTSWSSAATNIQDAVDACSPGDQVLATNGTYQAGSRVSSEGATNIVVVTNAISLQSVNGATVTIIDGGSTNRCVYLGNGARLAGFKITKGNAANGGGVYCASTNAWLQDCQLAANAAGKGGGVYSGTLSNCTLTDNSVGLYGSGAGAYGSVLTDCTLSSNAAANMGSGGGAANAILNNCTLTGNVTGSGMSGATVGGGATGSTLYNCTLSGNRSLGAGAAGGGAYACTLNNCTLSGNYADHVGGGAYSSSLTNCTLTSNNGSYRGGGVAESSVAVNCVLRNNTGGLYGGGVDWHCTAINCTIVGNSSQRGGGAVESALYNCICYYNSGSTGPNTLGGSYTYSCTPDPGGVGNITNAPLFVNRTGGDLHLLPGSPGIDVGTNAYVAPITDFDGNLRIANGTVDMGAYEFQQPDPMTVAIQAQYTNVVVGIVASFTGVFSRGKTDSWDFGDGAVVSNQVFVSHTWTAVGDYLVTLTVFDDSNPDGVSATFVIHVIPPPLSYVDPGSTNPVTPFSSWETAATNIQDAVDAVIFGARIVVTNGAYRSGGRVMYGSLSNRLAITKPVVVESFNGPAVTLIEGNPGVGDTAVRCVYLTNGATLRGFTLLSGATRAAGDSYKEQSGGGVWCESTNALVADCVLVSNSASLLGGGVYRGKLSHCTLSNNAAVLAGGGACSSVLADCLLLSNAAVRVWPPDAASGGGAESCTLSNCTLIGNVAANWQNDAGGGGANNSVLDQCRLTNNTAGAGAGASGSTLRNCILFGNSAAGSGGGVAGGTAIGSLILSNSSGSVGGGAIDCSLTNCLLAGNSSIYQGGGASGGVLHNCLVTGNASLGSAGGGAAVNVSGVGPTVINCTIFGNTALYAGGGVYTCTVWNSIIAGNSAPDGSNWYGGTLNYCCTTPLPTSGPGSFTNAPLFVDPAAGSFQLQSNSPCINAGSNVFTPSGLDLAGNARVVGGTVDVGAYECPWPALLDFFLWMHSYGLPTAASAVYADADNDRHNNWQEWVAATNPTNAASVLRLQAPVFNPPALLLSWSSDANHAYFVQRTTNLTTPPYFSTLVSNMPGLPATTTYTNTSAFSSKAVAFYRVGTTDPNAPPPILLQPPVVIPASVTLTWLSVTNRAYYVERATNLVPPAFSLLQTNIPGLPGTTRFTDTGLPVSSPAFYRIGVQP